MAKDTWDKPITKEFIKERLQQLHECENGLNKEMGRINHQIKQLEKEKKKIRKRISHNMKYRNRLINEL